MADARASALAFPRRPRRSTSHYLGRALLWFSECGRYRVVRYPEAERDAPAFRATVRVDGTFFGTQWLRVEPHRDHRHRSLRGAIDACQRHARAADAAANPKPRRPNRDREPRRVPRDRRSARRRYSRQLSHA